MPSALLDGARAVPAVPLPVVAGPAGVAVPSRPPRLPLPVAAAAVLAVLESLGLLAWGVSSLGGVVSAGARPDGGLVALALLLLAGWVVLCAGGGASLVDGAGRRLTMALAGIEIVLLTALVLAGVLGADGGWLRPLGPPGALPVPALALLALGLPAAKLLLAGAPSAVAWVERGGRPTAPRPAVQHRAVRGITVTCIGLFLTGIALAGTPADTSAGTPADTPAPSAPGPAAVDRP